MTHEGCPGTLHHVLDDNFAWGAGFLAAQMRSVVRRWMSMKPDVARRLRLFGVLVGPGG